MINNFHCYLNFIKYIQQASNKNYVEHELGPGSETTHYADVEIIDFPFDRNIATSGVAGKTAMLMKDYATDYNVPNYIFRFHVGQASGESSAGVN